METDVPVNDDQQPAEGGAAAEVTAAPSDNEQLSFVALPADAPLAVTPEEAPDAFVDRDLTAAVPLASLTDVDAVIASLEAEEQAGVDATGAGPVVEGAAAAEAEAATADAAEADATAAPDEPSSESAVDEQPALAAVMPVESARVRLWPFLAYGGVWVVYIAVLVWQLLEVPSSEAVFESAVYPFVLYGGLALTIAGPLLIVAVWLIERAGREQRAGLLLSALSRGSVATVVGVAAWWVAMIAVDYVRLGRLF